MFSPKPPAEISVLEFGSGFGNWLLMAKAFNYRTVGIEIEEDRILYAEKNGLEIYRSLNEVPDYSFEFIFSNQVFEHLNEPLQKLKDVVKKLKPGGIIQIGVPQGNQIKKIITRYPKTHSFGKMIDPIGHINGFTHNALLRLGEEAGLKTVSPFFIRAKYLKTMLDNRDLRYIVEILLAGYKQKNSCYLYFTK